MFINLAMIGYDSGLSADKEKYKLEHYFLIFYFLDGVCRYFAVGSNFLLFPMYFVFDVLVPVILLTAKYAEVDIGELSWSLFIMIRLLAPNRYMKLKVLSSGKIMLKALISSVNEQSYMLLGVIVFLIMAANIGKGFFELTDIIDIKLQPMYLPHVYQSLPQTVLHLWAIAFGYFYDASTMILIIRGQHFCKTQADALFDVPFNKNFDEFMKPTLNGQVKPIFNCAGKMMSVINEDLLANLTTKFFENLKKDLQSDKNHNEILKLFPFNPIFEFNETFLPNLRENLKNKCGKFDQETADTIRKVLHNSIKKRSLAEQCATPSEVKIFYLLFNLFAKFFVLNMLKAIVLEQYSREKERLSLGLTEDDIAEYMDRWRIWSNNMGNYGTSMPVRYATYFIRKMAPTRLKIIGSSEETIQHVLAKYKLPLREKDLYVHAFDMLVVAIAANSDCSAHADLKLMVRNLAVYILKAYPDYEFSSNTISMPEFLKGYYFGRLVLTAALQRKIREDILINEPELPRICVLQLKDETMLKRSSYFHFMNYIQGARKYFPERKIENTK